MVVRAFCSVKPLARRVVRRKVIAGDEGIKTPFAIMRVRSGNCTKKQREVIQGKNDVNSLTHTRWNCKYHIVFAPKYRRKVFTEKSDER